MKQPLDWRQRIDDVPELHPDLNNCLNEGKVFLSKFILVSCERDFGIEKLLKNE